MNRLDALFRISALSLLAFAYIESPAVQAQTFTILHAFTGGADGSESYAGLTPDGTGGFYGTTAALGESGQGKVFHLKNTNGHWVLQTIASNLDDPLGRVVFGPHGSLYGTTSETDCYTGGSGCGGVYSLRPACSNPDCPWIVSDLYKFRGSYDGAEPLFVDPVFDHAGNLYGTTVGPQYGVVFKLTPPAG